MNTIEKIKQLREETGISISECKKALEEANGDLKKAKEILKQKVSKLNSFGFLFNNSENILRGNYLLLIGIPSFEVEDPVEKLEFLGIIQVSDERDGNKFISDILYADVNEDTYLDFAIGRLPENESLASLMFSRGYLDTNKKALVASEYLYNDYFSILIYAGGGMLNARNIAEILEDKGYDVVRFVERRTNHEAFLSQLSVEEISNEPLHPYTKLLIESIPNVEKTQMELKPIPGTPPDMRNPPLGCRFWPRCPYALDKCRSVEPRILETDNRVVLCHLYGG